MANGTPRTFLGDEPRLKPYTTTSWRPRGRRSSASKRLASGSSNQTTVVTTKNYSIIHLLTDNGLRLMCDRWVCMCVFMCLCVYVCACMLLCLNGCRKVGRGQRWPQGSWWSCYSEFSKHLLKAVAQQTRMTQIKENKARDSRDNFECFYFSTTLEQKCELLPGLSPLDCYHCLTAPASSYWGM